MTTTPPPQPLAGIAARSDLNGVEAHMVAHHGYTDEECRAFTTKELIAIHGAHHAHQRETTGKGGHFG